MLNQELKDAVVSRILPNIRTPGQYVGGELNSVAKDHRDVRGTVCLAFPDTYALGHEPPRASGAVQPDERGRLGLRAGLHAAARFRGRAQSSMACRSTAWRPSRRCASSTCWAFRSSTRSATPTS